MFLPHLNSFIYLFIYIFIYIFFPPKPLCLVFKCNASNSVFSSWDQTMSRTTACELVNTHLRKQHCIKTDYELSWNLLLKRYFYHFEMYRIILFLCPVVLFQDLVTKLCWMLSWWFLDWCCNLWLEWQMLFFPHNACTAFWFGFRSSMVIVHHTVLWRTC